ncbi:MAG: hypothetical protein RLZZ448_707 [Actinomycetota bacterium]
MNFHALDVIGVRVEMPSNQPIVLLKEIGGVRYLPIWIGAVEATAIAFAQQGVTPPRPLTHDLMKDVLNSLQVSIDSIHLTELRDGIFYSLINLQGGISVSSRPSDAIALALRTGDQVMLLLLHCELDLLFLQARLFLVMLVLKSLINLMMKLKSLKSF